MSSPIVASTRRAACLFLVLLSVLLVPAAAECAIANSVAAGGSHTCAVTAAGGVKCWGWNAYGELGDGTTTDRLTPTQVSGLESGVASVAAGASHTCVVMTTGGVKCWGYNRNGQLGDGTTARRLTPTDVTGLATGVATVAAGGYHTCALTTSGGVKCWGANPFGQVGDGTTSDKYTPADVTGLASGVAAVTLGRMHTCALTTAAGAKCWGDNSYGQLGDGTATWRLTPADVSGLATGVAGVSAGGCHTCALTAAGGVKCWGENWYGQLGDGTTTHRYLATNVTGLSTDVEAVASAGDHTCALTTLGRVKCWGSNDSGQLADGTETPRATPVDLSGPIPGVSALSAGDSHTCAVTTGGGIRCWGLNDHGQIGNGGALTRPTPGDVPGLTDGVAAISAGNNLSCAVTTGGGAKCWGRNDYGQLGDGTTTGRFTPTGVLGLANGAAAVSAGASHTCAVTTGGGVECWGPNDYGQLGDATTADRSAPVNVSGLASGVAAVTVGAVHSCALTTAGGVKCWGSNYYGQLGDGTVTDRSTPVTVTAFAGGVAAVSAGGYHTCALTTWGAVKCWGLNSDGQLGDGTTTGKSTPVLVPGVMGDAVAVMAGLVHTCVVTSGGGVKCWGNNGYGQLGDGTTTGRTTPTAVVGLTTGMVAVAPGHMHTCALTTSGGVKCWGENANGRLGDGTTTSRLTPLDVSGLATGVVSVAAGFWHTCALTTAGAAKCWGGGYYGQLGDWRYGPRTTPTSALGFGRSDFDADDEMDIAVYRPSTGTWFSLESSARNASYRYHGWGVEEQNDTPVVGDFDGDGINDPTVFRPASGTWFVLKSGEGYTTWDHFGWGNATDVLVPGDYDGDGITDAAIFRPSEGKWYVRPSNGGTSWNVAFGIATDLPIAGDFDGDGKRDPAVYRASTGAWFWLKSSTNFTTYDYKGWGVDAQGDAPAPGDYDGDGKTDLCVFRPGTGTWYILESHAAFTTWQHFGWGTIGDTLVPGDYDGDGKTDAAVYRAATGTWYIRPSSGADAWSKVFGQSGDVPLVTIR